MTSIIARYVGRLVLGRFAILLLGLATLMMLLEFLADGDQVIASSDHAVRALAFYMTLRLPGILAELIPAAVLLAGLVSFAELARHSELTAIYAGGMSKIRLAGAVLPVALLIGGFQFVLEDQAQPVASRQLRAWGVGDYSPDNEAAHQIWLRHGEEILRIGGIDPERAELRDLTIFRLDADGNLTAKIQAARAVADGDGWTLFDVARTDVASASVDTAATMPWHGDLDAADLKTLVAKPSEMPLIDLLRVIERPALGSEPLYRYETQLHERLAAPVTTAMLLLLTVALARPPRGRAAAQGMLVAIGIGVGFVLWTFDSLVLNFGDLGLLPPVLAGWTPVPVIGAIALTIALHDHASQRAAAPARDRGEGARLVPT
jgi:lipopolysaccharide export system permease protein